jgi:hypothetical protein
MNMGFPSCIFLNDYSVLWMKCAFDCCEFYTGYDTDGTYKVKHI